MWCWGFGGWGLGRRTWRAWDGTGFGAWGIGFGGGGLEGLEGSGFRCWSWKLELGIEGWWCFPLLVFFLYPSSFSSSIMRGIFFPA